MAARKNKYAGRCAACNKWVTWDDHQVVIDLTVTALRPAYELGPNRGSLDEFVTAIVDEQPICSACWHATDAKYNMTKSALTTVRSGALVHPRAEFVWTKVR